MADTIEIFKQIYRNRFLRTSSFMMFLNKKDIFAEKIRHTPLEKYYPAFESRGEVLVKKLHMNIFSHRQN
jgi:hypothetical protein